MLAKLGKHSKPKLFAALFGSKFVCIKKIDERCYTHHYILWRAENVGEKKAQVFVKKTLLKS